ncbi:MAG: MarR family transcriptional regulator [Bacteroidetes bacterium]|nr:MarR family transcriptional regulator [Bacteroidota bacterium]
MAKTTHTVTKETRDLVNSIRRIVQALRVASRDSEKKLGLSAAQLFVLQKLKEEEDLSLNDLADRTLTHQSSVSVVVQRLVEKKLIKRDRSKEDARQLVLNLTDKGRKIVAKAPHARQEWMIDALEAMNPRSRKQFDATFKEFLQILHLDSDKPAPMLFADKGVFAPEKKRRSPKK